MKVGSRAQVFNGTADKTSGGLMKKDLFKDSYGRIRSKKASEAAKKRLKKSHGFNKYVEEAKKQKGKKFKKMQKIVKSSKSSQKRKGKKEGYNMMK